jgi:hypothetical protein
MMGPALGWPVSAKPMAGRGLQLFYAKVTHQPSQAVLSWGIVMVVMVMAAVVAAALPPCLSRVLLLASALLQQ